MGLGVIVLPNFVELSEIANIDRRKSGNSDIAIDKDMFNPEKVYTIDTVHSNKLGVRLNNEYNIDNRCLRVYGDNYESWC